MWGVATLNGAGIPSQYFGPTVPNHPDVASGSWDYAGAYGSCYENHATAYEDIGGTIQGAGSPTLCAYWTPPKYTLSLWSEVDGYTSSLSQDRYEEGTTVTLTANPPPNYRFTGWSGDVTSSQPSITFQLNRDMAITVHFAHETPPPLPPDGPINNYDDSNCQAYQNCHSPIVLNIGNGGYRLSGKDDPVLFDIDATGAPVRIAWTAAGAPMAFLALDRNGNGRIDDGAELFGNHTPVPGGVAANGFDALAQYDANHDGWVDAGDPIWPSLLLWTDLNHDGISQPSELSPLASGDVIGINLAYHWTGRRDPTGNTFRYESQVRMDIGHHARTRPVYDIFFVAAR